MPSSRSDLGGAARWIGLGLALLAAPAACAPRFEVDGARAHARVVHQVEAGPRIPGRPGHAAIAEWIANECARLGGRVARQAFVDSLAGHRLELTNLVAHYGPDQGKRIALVAHWDSRPWSDQDPDSTFRLDPVPGANDGASGVAVLLEVAELLHRRPPRVAVDLVFVDGEDQGRAEAPGEFCLGARAYARRVTGEAAAQRPTAAFVFDMVGDRDLDIQPETQSVEHASNLVDLVLEGAKATGGRGFLPTPRFTLTDDHMRLLEAGIPAIDVVDFDYPAWHTHLDLPDRVSPASLAEVSRVAAWLVYSSPLATP
ncbi:MAG TPA: M28 family peptidase [Candidatus Saccharimonadaceae bacterium]|nr:M28 family peptidase [Candidatus Saccharimonadaceae bacterium]